MKKSSNTRSNSINKIKRYSLAGLFFSVGILIFALLVYAATRPIFLNQPFLFVASNKNVSLEFLNEIEQGLSVRAKMFEGQYIWATDIDEVLRSVLSDVRIASASVKRKLPNQIVIEYVPQLPVANLLSKKGNRVHPIAADGKILPAVTIANGVNGPILRGKNFFVDKTIRVKTIDWLAELKKQDAVMAEKISEVVYDKKNGYKIFLTMNATEVWLGEQDLDRRLVHVGKVLNYLETKKLEGRVIDARLSKKVVVKLRGAP